MRWNITDGTQMIVGVLGVIAGMTKPSHLYAKLLQSWKAKSLKAYKFPQYSLLKALLAMVTLLVGQ
jgi:hypothetical protein